MLSVSCVPLIEGLVLALPRLRCLDSRGNRLSMEGIRALALFLASQSQGLHGRAAKHMYVQRDGQIEAIGASPSGEVTSLPRISNSN